PAYEFSEKEIADVDRYGWYVPNRDIVKLDGDRMRMGNLTISQWASWTLNDWIGRPKGILVEPETVRRLLINQMNTLAAADVSAEPYWGIFPGTTDGRLTGNNWSIGRGEIVLFDDRREAERVVKHLGPPKDVGPTGEPGVSWTIRGISKES